ncbi:MAG: hypothetical protein JW741_11550 [Sedimentisphaerales bacterium]|nr:hypothetical protein [Sedimentisphaerales bacterium]
MGDPSRITYRKHTFLSSVAMGLSAIVITVILSGTGVLVYGIHLASEKSERVITLAQGAVRGLPELSESLPPVLSDMLDDRRQPDYSNALAITAKLTTAPGPYDGTGTAIEIVNNGSEVVSLLSLRVIILDNHGRLISEGQEWAATPFAADHEWRGPIMPGSRRYFVSARRLHNISLVDELRPEVEITELRVWNGPDNAPAIGDESLSEATASGGADTTAAEKG